MTTLFLQWKNAPRRSTGITFPQWLDQLDEILHHHIGKTHADFDYDWDWHWNDNDQPALWKAEDILRRELPQSFNDVWQHYNHFA